MPVHRLRAGRTLIVNGPASIRLLEGKASILACPLTPKRQVVVKSWRSRPVYAEEDSLIECVFGGDGSVEEVDGDTIPAEWTENVRELSSRDNVALMVLGSSDSGKTSLATLALNTILGRGSGGVFVDLDVGQSNLCPPTTVGYVYLRSPIPDISHARAEGVEVAGYTSPAPIVEKHLEAVRRLHERIREKYPGAKVVIDVDGWVGGEGAADHKAELVRILGVDCLLVLGDVPKEVVDSCGEASVDIRRLPSASLVRKRSMDARKKLREMMYERFLRKSVLRTIPASWVEVEYIGGEKRTHKISAIINRFITLFSEEKGTVIEGGLEELAKTYGAGILSYVYDPEYRFSGIGLMTQYDLKKNLLRIYTPFQSQIKKVVFSSIIVSTDGSELYSTRPQSLET